jgi:signal transduction histidine kinase
MLPLVETDVKKFQQVIFNLLSNAVKFSDPAVNKGRPGHVKVRAETLPEAEGLGERVRVSVLDNGPGIPPEDQERVFGKFERVKAGHTTETGGTGLGLAICKELTRVLQGDLQLVSEVGSGSMFSLIVPLSIDPERVEEARLEARFRGTLARRNDWD